MLTERGVDLLTLKELLGHVEISTTLLHDACFDTSSGRGDWSRQVAQAATKMERINKMH